jgi:hypothetical protein
VPQPCASIRHSKLADSVISIALRAFDTGQFSFASVATFWKVAASMPGTEAFVTRSIRGDRKPTRDRSELHLGVRVYFARRMPSLGQRGGQRHREASRVGRRNRLFGIRTHALGEARVVGILALERAAAELDGTMAGLQIATPFRI